MSEEKVMQAVVLNITKTSQDWQNEATIIRKGLLCIEITSSGDMLAKVGDGEHIYSDLPYISDGSFSIEDYYTKVQVDTMNWKILFPESNTFTLNNRETAAFENPITNINVSLAAPVKGEDYSCGVNFTVLQDFVYSESVPSEFVIRWRELPSWIEGNVYEIIYRCLWVKDSDGKYIITALWNELEM